MKREDLPPRAAKAAVATTRGVHHLALNTEDMRVTADFYTKVVGMPLVHAMRVPPGLGTGPANRGNPPYERIRHYFFDMGNDSLLAFFEIPRGAEPRAKRDGIGGMQHVAFAVTPKNFAALQKRLRKNGVAFDGPIEILPRLLSIYFIDPNGIRLEACCQPAARDKQRVIRSVQQRRSEAREELETIDAQWARATIAAGGFT